MIVTPDTADPVQNEQRRCVLRGYRRYPNGVLFAEFPADVTWSRVRLDGVDFTNLLCAKTDDLVALAGEGRRIADAAQNYIADVPASKKFRHVDGIIEGLRAGVKHAPIICLQYPDARVVVLEGHSRAIARMILGMTDVNALLGRAPSFDTWHWR